MLLPLFMAFLVSRERHDFIIKSPIYRSIRLQIRVFIMVMLSPYSLFVLYDRYMEAK